MQSSADLPFDIMEVDTKLAQEYLESNSTIQGLGYENLEEYEVCIDRGSYKIYYTKNLPEIVSVCPKLSDMRYLHYLCHLADEIEKNINLFCQLENLIRGKSIKATELELLMIIKYFRYATAWRASKDVVRETLLMEDDSPLIDLGFFAHLTPTVTILATINTAVVCYLFANLCREAGFEVEFCIVKDIKDISNTHETKGKALRGGCIGVVTAQADVDSAVDAFLAAPNGDVWGIRRVLVEESASERLTSALSWKTRGRSKTNKYWPCTEAYEFADRTFLREYVGEDTYLKNVVIIEPFRTVKELLALIESYSPFCVSLWSASVAQSNEIVFGISAPMVWVNGYGTLGDSNYVSLAYFSQLVPRNNDDLPGIGEVLTDRKKWAKLTNDKRSLKLKSAIVTLENYSGDNTRRYFLRNLYQTQALENTVEIGARDMVIRIWKPLDLYFIKFDKNPMTIIEAIKRLLSGSGIVLSYIDKDNVYVKILNNLSENGIPVHLIKHRSEYDALYNSVLVPEPCRIVHTNFGTIFAN